MWNRPSHWSACTVHQPVMRCMGAKQDHTTDGVVGVVGVVGANWA